MRMDFLPSLNAYDPAERAGVIRSLPLSPLSDLDRSGVVYKQARKKDDFPAVGSPVYDLPGVNTPANAAGESQGEQRTRLEAQAKQLINQTFFGTILKQMRDSPFKSDLFEGGRGGQAFGQLFDQKMVEQMSRGAGKKLVNAIVRKFEARRAYAASGADNRLQDPRQAARQGPAANTAASTEGEPFTSPAAATPPSAGPATQSTQKRPTLRSITIHANPGFRA
jgi:Rod binding domain-containing protein